MSDQTDTLMKTFLRLGLEEPEINIYLHLLQKGTKSALEISRQMHVARTRVYRILDKLKAKGLVAEKFDTLGLKFTANPHSRLDLLLADRQSELDSVKAQLPLVRAQLDALVGKDPGSKVLYHHGIDGLKHVTWNSLSARGPLRIMEVSDSMTAFLPQEFSETVRTEFAKRQIPIRQLTNLTHIRPHTGVSAILPLWEIRHIPHRELSITTEILIYNSVTALYHYQNDDIFCVEIENPDLAAMQTQMFDFVWKKAKKMKKVGNAGEAVL